MKLLATLCLLFSMSALAGPNDAGTFTPLPSTGGGATPYANAGALPALASDGAMAVSPSTTTRSTSSTSAL